MSTRAVTPEMCPWTASFHPLGFPLLIRTNSRPILEIAEEAWSSYPESFEVEPLELLVRVSAERLPQGPRAVPAPPVFRVDPNGFSLYSDDDNFASCDRRSLTGSIYLSAIDRAWVRWHFLEAAVYTLLAQRHVVPIHAALIEKHGSGVLLCGHSGAGKSTLSFACAQEEWTYLSDDAAMLLPGFADRVALGKPHQLRLREDAAQMFPALAGYPVHLRPNGKRGIEVPTRELNSIRTGFRCKVDRLVILDRRPGLTPGLEAVPREDVLSELMRDMPSYGEEVDALQQRTISAVSAVPASRMRYETPDDAIRLLEGLVKSS